MSRPQLEKKSQNYRKSSTLGWMAWALMVCGCGGSQQLDKRINESWQWDGGVEASRVLDKINDHKGPPRLSAVVGVTGFGVRGQLLPQGKIWNFESPVDVLPSIAGSAVLFTGGGNLHALDLKSGKELFQASVSGRRLEGVGYDGNYFLVLLVDADDAREDELRMFRRDGLEMSNISVTAHLGTPAVVDGIGLVPYDGQYVAGFDIASKTWLGRLLYRDALHSVTADERGVLLWGQGVTRLDTKLSSSPDSQALLLPLAEFPGSPSWPVDGSKPRPARAQSINIFATPASQDAPLKFAHDLYVATYYQIVLGVQPGTDQLAWVNHLPRPIIGGAIAESNVTVCLEDGSVLRLNLNDGGITPFGSLDARLKACVVTAANEPVEHQERPELEQQIVETITSTGPDMAKVQILLLDRMASTPGEATTRALLQISQDPLVSSELARHAGQLIAKRTSGGEEMVRVLNEFSAKRAVRLKLAAQSSEINPDVAVAVAEANASKDVPAAGQRAAGSDDEWENEKSQQPGTGSMGAIQFPSPQADELSSKKTLRPPPVDSIARALMTMKTPGAAAALAKYLDDPALNAAQIKVVMKAVYKLGGPDEVEPVHTFLLIYKNTGGETDLIDALVQATEFLLTYLIEPKKSEVKAEVNESLTHPEVQRRAKLIKITRSSAQANQPGEAEGRAPSKPDDTTAAPQSGGPPISESQP